MNFLLEQDRLNHSLARLIPRRLWESPFFFDREMNYPSQTFAVMRAPIVEIANILEDKSSRTMNKQNKKCLALVIVLSHPELELALALNQEKAFLQLLENKLACKHLNITTKFFIFN
jgi:hypothetical protein